MAISTPVTVTPANRPPSISGPWSLLNNFGEKPTITGVAIAKTPGRTISLIADFVEISTQRPCSALFKASSYMLRSFSSQSFSSFRLMSANAFFNSGISRNWRRTSSIIAIAARPTAPMAIDENKKGSIPPTNNPAITIGFDISILVISL